MSTDRPTLSVVIPWCDRPEIAATLRHNGPLFAARDAEIIVTNCGGDEHELERALSGVALTAARVLTVRAEGFNKSLAINLGASVARAPWLGVLDADVLLDSRCLEEMCEALQPDAVVTVARVVESARRPSGAASDLTDVVFTVELRRGRRRDARVETNHIRLSDGSRSGPGLAFMSRRAFIAVGGMNSELTGWGWEDVDLLLRLRVELDVERREAGTVTHLTHARTPAPQPGTAVVEATNMTRCLANYAIGDLRGTYERDTAAWQRSTVVRPLG